MERRFPLTTLGIWVVASSPLYLDHRAISPATSLSPKATPCCRNATAPNQVANSSLPGSPHPTCSTMVSGLKAKPSKGLFRNVRAPQLLCGFCPRLGSFWRLSGALLTIRRGRSTYVLLSALVGGVAWPTELLLADICEQKLSEWVFWDLCSWVAACLCHCTAGIDSSASALALPSRRPANMQHTQQQWV